MSDPLVRAHERRAPDDEPQGLPIGPTIEVRRGDQGSLRCPYCHATFDTPAEPVRTCARCWAVQHRECWREGGSCATCRATSFVEEDEERRRRAVGQLVGAVLLLVALGLGLARLTTRTRVPPKAPALSRIAVTLPDKARTASVVVTPGLGDEPPRPVPTAAEWSLGALDLAEKAVAGVTHDDLGGAGLAHVVGLAKMKAPDDAVVWCRCGEAQTLAQEYTLAERTLDRAVELDPRFIRARASRAELRLRTDRPEGAWADLETGLHLGGEDAKLLSVLGEAFWLQGDLAREATALNRSAQLDPKDPETFRRLALLAKDKGDVASCLAAADKALALAGSPSRREWRGCLVVAVQGPAHHFALDCAVADLDARELLANPAPFGLEHDPTVTHARADARSRAARARAGRSPNLAESLLDSALVIERGHDEARHLRVELHAARGDFKRALEDLDWFVDHALWRDALESALLERAVLRQKAGNVEGSTEDLRHLDRLKGGK